MNLLASCEYKANRYRDLKNLILTPHDGLRLILLEISSLGFILTESKELKKRNEGVELWCLQNNVHML